MASSTAATFPARRLQQQDVARLGLSAAAQQIHERSLIVDLHVDILLQRRLFGWRLTGEASSRRLERGLQALGAAIPAAMACFAGSHRPLYDHADVPRMIRGGYGGLLLELHYWPIQSEAGWREINRQIAVAYRLADEARIEIVRSPEQLRQAVARGQLAAVLAIEGLHALGAGGKHNAARRVDRLQQLWDQGVRCITLAHFSRNDAVGHCFGPGSDPDAGLTDFGRVIVRSMNDLGMIIDLAHVSPRGILDVCEVTSQPVIASHTGLRGVDPRRSDSYVDRLLDDRCMRAIAETGGTIGIMLCPTFLSGHRDGLSAVVRHLDYGIERLRSAGIDGTQCFSIGSDFDGWIPDIPDDLNGAEDIPLITEAFVQRGYSEETIRGIWGANFLRVWEAVLRGNTI